MTPGHVSCARTDTESGRVSCTGIFRRDAIEHKQVSQPFLSKGRFL